MAKRGPKPYQKNAEAARQVELLAGFGTKQDDIAQVIGIAESTLKKYYQEELSKGGPRANARVAQNLYKMTEKVPAAAMFWLKCRAGWKDHSALELTGKDGAPLQAVIVIGKPDQQ